MIISKRNQIKLFIAGGVIFAIFIIIPASIENFKTSKELKENGVITKATITRKNFNVDSDSWFFTYEFQDKSLTKHFGKTTFYNGNPNQYLIGDTIEIKYLVENPSICVVNSKSELDSGYLIGFAFVIILFLFLGAFGYHALIKKNVA